MDAQSYIRDAIEAGTLATEHIEQFVRFWQAGHGLNVDGKPGPLTLATMKPAQPAAGIQLTGPAFGIDVSHHQGVIDWSAVAASREPKIQFAWIKASSGVDAPDRKFLVNARGASGAGLRWGAYHWATPSANDAGTDARAEAADFLGRIAASGVAPTLPCALDLEETKGPTGEQLAEWVLEWLDAVEKVLNIRPFVYTGPWFLQKAVFAKGVEKLRGERLWIADYTGDVGNTYAWQWQVHQFSSTGKVSGIKGRVDLNRLTSGAEL